MIWRNMKFVLCGAGSTYSPVAIDIPWIFYGYFYLFYNVFWISEIVLIFKRVVLRVKPWHSKFFPDPGWISFGILVSLVYSDVFNDIFNYTSLLYTFVTPSHSILYYRLNYNAWNDIDTTHQHEILPLYKKNRPFKYKRN